MAYDLTREEAAQELRELANEMYERLEEMLYIIEIVIPEEYERAERYWATHIDEALMNEYGHSGSMFMLKDAIEALESEEDND